MLRKKIYLAYSLELTELALLGIENLSVAIIDE